MGRFEKIATIDVERRRLYGFAGISRPTNETNLCKFSLFMKNVLKLRFVKFVQLF